MPDGEMNNKWPDL